MKNTTEPCVCAGISTSGAAPGKRPVSTRSVFRLGALVAIVTTGAVVTVACGAPPVPDLVITDDPVLPPERKSAPMLSDASSTSPWPEDHPAENEKPADAGTRLESADAEASPFEAGAPETPVQADAGTRGRPDASTPVPPARPKCVGWPVIEAEPNDAPSQSTAIGDAICGAVDMQGDVDRFLIDSTRRLTFNFFAQGDAVITITAPSGQVDSGSAPGTYTSWEVGRFSVVIASPSGQVQDYVIERF